MSNRGSPPAAPAFNRINKITFGVAFHFPTISITTFQKSNQQILPNFRNCLRNRSKISINLRLLFLVSFIVKQN